MSKPDLTALVGSRICHDLISPLGAIGNGVELMQLSGLGDSPEMALIAQSVENANLRIRFFRIAFGAAGPEQMVAEREIRTALDCEDDGRKIGIDWQPAGVQPRAAVKLAFLLLQCFETVMPWGGHVRVSCEGDAWQITGEAERIRHEPGLWRAITDPEAPFDLIPAQVHFALIAPELARQGRTGVVTLSEAGASVRF